MFVVLANWLGTECSENETIRLGKATIRQEQGYTVSLNYANLDVHKLLVSGEE